MTNKFEFEANIAAKKITMSREFNAPVEKVWRAFTEPELLAKWIAPKPWSVENHTLDLTVGGYQNMRWLVLRARCIGCMTNLLR